MKTLIGEELKRIESLINQRKPYIYSDTFNRLLSLIRKAYAVNVITDEEWDEISEAIGESEQVQQKTIEISTSNTDRVKEKEEQEQETTSLLIQLLINNQKQVR